MSVSKLSEELIKAGQDAEVLTTTANGQKELDVKSGEKQMVDEVPVTYFKRLSKDHTHFSPALLNQLLKLLKRKRVPSSLSVHTQYLIHIHAWWNLVSILSCIIALWKGGTVILSPRGTLSNYSFGNRNSLMKRIFHALLGKRLLHRCHFHVTSLKEKTAMLALCNPKTITVIPNFVRFPEIDQRGFAQEKVPLQLIFMSRIEEKKGLDILLEALSETIIPFYLTIAGAGEEKYVQQLKLRANKLHISDQINWIGHQEDFSKFRIMRENDLFVLPSHDENFANIVIECLSVGTAVLISEDVGLADYVQENQFGWISKNQPIAFRQHIEDIYKQKERLHDIRKNAPQKVRADFNDATLIKQYLDMYTSIVQGD